MAARIVIPFQPAALRSQGGPDGRLLSRPGALEVGPWKGHIVYLPPEAPWRESFSASATPLPEYAQLDDAQQRQRGFFDRLLGLLYGIDWSGRVTLSTMQKEACRQIEWLHRRLWMCPHSQGVQAGLAVAVPLANGDESQALDALEALAARVTKTDWAFSELYQALQNPAALALVHNHPGVAARLMDSCSNRGQADQLARILGVPQPPAPVEQALNEEALADGAEPCGADLPPGKDESVRASPARGKERSEEALLDALLELFGSIRYALPVPVLL
ncbi:hypothetical protein [Paracidovorax citrulli]